MRPSCSRSSRSTLNLHTIELFTGNTLFDRTARATCRACCLPRKELYESWEVARRIRRKMRGGYVVDLAAGHGLLGVIMLILDDTSPRVTCVDRRMPPSHLQLLSSLQETWPRLRGRVDYIIGDVATADLPYDALVVSAHACGALTDQVLELAISKSCKVAVLPCCQSAKSCDTGSLEGWMDESLAIDATRVARLRSSGYVVKTQTIPTEITPKNRLLLGWRKQ